MHRMRPPLALRTALGWHEAASQATSRVAALSKHLDGLLKPVEFTTLEIPEPCEFHTGSTPLRRFCPPRPGAGGHHIEHSAGHVWVVAEPGDVSVFCKGHVVHVGSGEAPGRATIVAVRGGLRVELWGSVGTLICDPTAGDENAVPVVSVQHNATVERFVGVTELPVIHGRLFGDGALVQILGAQVTSLSAQGTLAGGTLVDVDVTELPAQQIKSLEELAVCSPDVSSLYNDVRRWSRRSAWRARGRTVEYGASLPRRGGTPRARAHWYRDLYGAVRTHALPATTRAAIRWCYARLEHEAMKAPIAGQGDRSAQPSSDRVARSPLGERAGRWLYRLVGYGHRPARAATTWLIVTAATTVWSVCTVPVNGGAVEYGLRFVTVLMAPLRILRFGGEASGPLVRPDGLDGLAYAVVGVPFIFVVLSLREFFRSPLAGKPGTR